MFERYSLLNLLLVKEKNKDFSEILNHYERMNEKGLSSNVHYEYISLMRRHIEISANPFLQTILGLFNMMPEEKQKRCFKVCAFGIDLANHNSIAVDLDLLNFVLLFHDIGSVLTPDSSEKGGGELLLKLGGKEVESAGKIIYNSNITYMYDVTMTEFDLIEEEKVVLDILDYCNLHLDEKGDSISPLARLDKIKHLYGGEKMETLLQMDSDFYAKYILPRYNDLFTSIKGVVRF